MSSGVGTGVVAAACGGRQQRTERHGISSVTARRLIIDLGHAARAAKTTTFSGRLD
jgi:hypothetical protein